MKRIFVCFLLQSVVHAQNITTDVFKYVKNNQPVDDNCKVCLSKCCPGTQIRLKTNASSTCVDNVNNITILEDTQVNIYNKDIKKRIIKTDKTLKNFQFVYSDVFNDPFVVDIMPDRTMAFYILEDGSLASRFFNYLDQWPNPILNYTVHCLDVQVTGENGTPDWNSVTVVQRFRAMVVASLITKEDDKYKNVKKNVTASAMLVSCFFLLLVLTAYGVLPQKRNLPCIMLMAYVTCLFTTFLFRAVQVFTSKSLEKQWCTFIGLGLYYSFWASFTWMNVMSYDMWSTTCKSRSPRWEPRRKIIAKFLWYSIYGFGVPLLLSAFMVGIDFADLTSVPDFVQPHFVNSTYCYFEHENERRLYVNAPIVVAKSINIFFFIMTAMYVWRHSAKPGGSGESRNTKKEQNRFAIYVKLTVIMGVNWILDVLGAFISPDSWAWLVADLFNSLVGFFIFFIFVCKREMVVQLCKRFSIETDVARRWESTVVTSISVSKRQLSKEARRSEKEAEGEKLAEVNQTT